MITGAALQAAVMRTAVSLPPERCLAQAQSVEVSPDPRVCRAVRRGCGEG